MTALALPAISFTLDGAAEATSIGATRIKEATDRGDLVCHWNGAKRVYLAADLVAWVESLPTERPS